jgi:hypothetical protein
MFVLFLAFPDTSILIAIVGVLIYIPSSSVLGLHPLSPSLPAFVVVYFLGDSHSDAVR